MKTMKLKKLLAAATIAVLNVTPAVAATDGWIIGRLTGLVDEHPVLVPRTGNDYRITDPTVPLAEVTVYGDSSQYNNLSLCRNSVRYGEVISVRRGGQTYSMSSDRDQREEWLTANGLLAGDVLTFNLSGMATVYEMIAPPVLEDKPYDGTVQTATVPASDKWTVAFAESGAHAGTYDVFLRLTDFDVCRWTGSDGRTIAVPFTVTQAENAWTGGPSISGWTFGDMPSVPVATAKFGAVRPVVYSGTTASGATVANAPAVSEAGNYTATFDVEGTADYTALHAEVPFVVARQNVSGAGFAVSVGANPKYNGMEQTLPVERVTFNGEAIPYSVTGNKATHAGTYVLSITAGGNFPGTTNIEWKILPRSVTLTSGSATKVYDGSALTKGGVSVSGDGFAGSDGATYSVTGARTDAGTGENSFTYQLKSGTLPGNYQISTVKGTLTVTKATNSWSVQPTVTGKTYDGTPVSYSVGIPKFGSSTVAFSPGGSTPIEVGSYTASFSVPGTGNYTALAKTISFAIDPAPVVKATLSAEARWKLLKATGTYFAQIKVRCTDGYAAGISNLRIGFADRISSGKVLAQLWSSPNRSAVAGVFSNGGSTYRVTPISASTITGENVDVIYGVNSLSADTIPVAERTIEMYVPKRDLASHLNEYTAILVWESNGETYTAPVANKSVQ